ncbi:MAG TPA: undecaprenyl-phosphate glucose phosphotransferase [Steroidobacteraceae bacterium]|nr:undecaprenyl-phosphate glucose phosphotransferase [Steroidobacteraceae bacterium]
MSQRASGYNVSQPIFFKQSLSVAPLLLWLQFALPPLVAGALLYPLTQIYDVEFSRAFLALSVTVTALAFVVLPNRDPAVQLLSGRLPMATSLVVRWAVLLASLLALGYVTKFSEDFSRRVVLTWALTAPALIIVLMLVLQEVTKRLLADVANARRAIFVGCNETSMSLAGRIAAHGELGLSVAGFFDDRGSDRLGCGGRARLLGQFADVAAFVKARRIDVIFVAMPLGHISRVHDLVDQLGDTTASIYYVPDIFVFDDLIQPRTSEMLGIPVVAMCETPFHGYRGVIKRLMDLFIAGNALIVFAPLMLAIAMAIKWTSPGPVIFRQRRYGLDGREIGVYKFRTMSVCEDGTDFTQATRNDQRVTPLGRVLRRYSLDELPQLINVLQGRMSLVGPRPHAIAHNEECRKLIKRYMVRHKVLPGMTGLAQVSGCRGETARIEDMEARVRLDLEYLRNWSPLLDLQILLLTAQEVIRTDKAY